MRLLAIGLSHRTAPVELRECVDFSRRGLDVALEAVSARGLGPEVVVLSTCNRAEIYGVVESDAAREAIALFFSEYHGIDHSRVEGHLYRHEDAHAVRHLFRVAAGLDSLVTGEAEILGQVKTAYAAARERRATGPLTNRLFHSAFNVGKRVRTETGLCEAIVTESLATRSTKLERAEAIVAREVNRFTSWLQSREIFPTLVALRQRFESIRLAELTRLERKLSALSPDARTRLDEITRLIVEKLLLTPTEQLESVSDGAMGVRYTDALNRLFRLAAEDDVEPPEYVSSARQMTPEGHVS
jgi:glutamyl-tRNA reductase